MESAARSVGDRAVVTFGPRCSEPLSRSELLSWLRSDCQVSSERKLEVSRGFQGSERCQVSRGGPLKLETGEAMKPETGEALKLETGEALKPETILRPVGRVVLHCSATKLSQDYTYDRLARDHKKRGFGEWPGYHFYVRKDGTLYYCRPIGVKGCHVKGHNEGTVGVCYEGGLDEWGKPMDTRTAEQMITLHWLLLTLHEIWPRAKICGHRDFSPDRNGNGKIERWEYIKACPCFDAAHEYAYIFGEKL